MQELSASHRLRRLWNKFRVLGFSQALKSVKAAFRPKRAASFPLASADPDLILAANVGAIRDFARKKKGLAPKQTALSKKIEDLFPLEYKDGDGQTMRYAFFPSLKPAKGLVVVFHGYLGFEIDQIRYSWQDFDILLPLDNFGWKGLGAWFWGEGGSNHVELLTSKLIQKIRKDRSSPLWFAVGASMGAFAALYHGIKYVADGVYVMNPIIDIKSKIRYYQQLNADTTYTALVAANDAALERVPDIYREAKAAATLPPLFLIQNQYDRSNLFGEHTLPLLATYHEKKAWAGLRVQPAIGHQGHDGGYGEAQYFFGLIAAKSPPRVVDFYDQE